MWNVNRPKVTYLLFVHFEKFSAGWKVVVNDIEDFTFDSGFNSGQDNGIGTIINKR